MNRDEKIKMIGRLRGLSDSNRILLRNRLGEYFDMQKPNVRMLLLYVAPENAPSMQDAPVYWQNLFFISSVYCRIPAEAHAEKPEHIENELAAMIIRTFNDKDAGDNRMSDILALHTGKRGTLYPALAQLIRGLDSDLDCISLFDDLEYWEKDSRIQERWARAYINALRKDEENDRD